MSKIFCRIEFYKDKISLQLMLFLKINLNNVDGFLIGGASLKSESFCQIIENVLVENN